jgi:hypothetical protein
MNRELQWWPVHGAFYDGTFLLHYLRIMNSGRFEEARYAGCLDNIFRQLDVSTEDLVLWKLLGDRATAVALMEKYLEEP